MSETEAKKGPKVLHKTEILRKAGSRWGIPKPYVHHEKEDSKRKLKPGTLRRHKRDHCGKSGTEGIRIRSRRLLNHVQRSIIFTSESLSQVLGKETFGRNNEDGRWIVRKSYLPPIRGALDKFIIEIFAQAHSYAKQRHRGDEAGVKLMKSDLETALHWYKRIKIN